MRSDAHHRPTPSSPVELSGSWPPPDPVVQAWRELALAAGNPFATPEWLAAWLETHPEDRPVWGVARDDDNAVCGVLGLVRTRRAGARALAAPGGTDYMDPPVRLGAELELAEAWGRALAQIKDSWDVVALDRVTAGRAWGARVATGMGGSGARLVALKQNATLPSVDISDGYDAWLASRSRNFRSQLGRRRRRLEREHRTVFRRTVDAAALGHDLDILFDLHRRRWTARGGEGVLPSHMRPFHEAFARRALGQGWLRLWTLELDGTPVASWYGWRCGDSYCYYQSGFDPEYEARAPGSVMLAHTIEQAAAEGATAYELLWGDEEYKDRFATHRREAATVLLFRPTRPAGAALAAVARARDAALRLPPRMQDPLRRLVRRLR
jgi:CelD/BcsL family acetyltransferase involved in cellulose biosynthesis